MDLGVALVADPQPAEVVQVRETAFDNPALPSDARAVLRAATSDHRLDPPLPQQSAVLVVVIAAVGKQQIGFLARSAGLAGNWTAVQILQQRDELGHVVAVTAGQRDCQRDAAGVNEQVML